MHSVIHPPENKFVIAADHPNRKAHEWIDEQLDALDWNGEVQRWYTDRQSEPIVTRVLAQPKAFQIPLLQACLERMIWHRERCAPGDGMSADYLIGSVMYTTVSTLYRRKLPYSESDICQILRLSRHKCGHGCDVTPPVEIAVKYAREHGITDDLLAALRDFMEGLKGLGTTHVNSLKRKLGLLSVLDAEADKGKKRCWSDRVRTGLQTLPRDEQAQWRRLILHMNANDIYEMPNVWRKEAVAFVEKVGAAVVVERLAAWWPDVNENAVWPIQTGGSHLLKYFVWLLNISGESSEVQPKCIDLACRLSELDWKPRNRAQKAMIAAAFYLRSCPPPQSWPALQRLACWSASAPDGARGDKIRDILKTYAQEHKLALT